MTEQTHTSQPKVRIASSVLETFGDPRINQSDLDTIQGALHRLMESPKIGTPIPFSHSGPKNIYVYRTDDGKWRILFQSDQSSIDVLSIDRETSI